MPVVDQSQDGDGPLESIGFLGVVVLASPHGAAASADAAVVGLDMIGVDLSVGGDRGEGMLLVSPGNPSSALGALHLGCHFNPVGQALAVADPDAAGQLLPRKVHSDLLPELRAVAGLPIGE